jgi:protein ImuB
MFERLPVELPLEARKHADRLHGIGCGTVADLLRLPRSGVKKRCGVELLHTLDRATGSAPEIHEWFEMAPTFEARVELPDRIEHAEACLFAARRLIVQLTRWLSSRQLALRKLAAHLEHERGRSAVEPTTFEIALAEPTWREDHIVRLLKERLTRVELVAAVMAVRIAADDVTEAEPPSD